MASKAIKRKPCTADTEKIREKQMETIVPDSVREPLLGNNIHESKSEKYEPTMQHNIWDGKKQEGLHWMHLISTFIAQSVRKIGSAISQFASLLARLFSWSCGSQGSQSGQTILVDLSPLQEERLRSLGQRLDVPFDSSSVKHQDALKELWRLAYPSRQLPPLKSAQWKEMGWQNSDPATDFRAGGFMSLENLIYFARNYPVCFYLSINHGQLLPTSLSLVGNWIGLTICLNMQDSFHSLLHKADGKRAEWEYPFAVAGVNISYMLVQMLDLQSGKMSTKAGSHFVQLLTDDEMAFDNLFCVAFQMLDAQWLSRGASYMEFNVCSSYKVWSLHTNGFLFHNLIQLLSFPFFRRF
ncbi:hypothetical protein GUJ93_ZPchr0011g28673 [Zizania palustris]|uniref:ELMO domain-containing protein n=1 Tax=Zizania palustris TaxID=103762 RepID=A0A8J5WI18_ZIZPA|nr:hypothetical protein GUJ93_ZPchr0011g28673 [Zizania palustris]